MDKILNFILFFFFKVVHVSAISKFSVYSFDGNLSPRYKTTKFTIRPGIGRFETMRFWKVGYSNRRAFNFA